MINLSAIHGSRSPAINARAKKPLALLRQSFASQLSQVVALQHTATRTNPSAVSRQILPIVPGQKTAASQGFAGPSQSKTPAEATAAQPALSGFAALASIVGSAAVSLAQTAEPAQQHWYASDSADDAYWSKQPAPVQQLREISDPDQRAAVGTQLASEGYSIDVPIMVWGWDAGKVTQLRQDFGYTWVPSAQQMPLSAAPGITGPGLAAYDPAHPPAGSIAV